MGNKIIVFKKCPQNRLFLGHVYESTDSKWRLAVSLPFFYCLFENQLMLESWTSGNYCWPACAKAALKVYLCLGSGMCRLQMFQQWQNLSKYLEGRQQPYDDCKGSQLHLVRILSPSVLISQALISFDHSFLRKTLLYSRASFHKLGRQYIYMRNYTTKQPENQNSHVTNYDNNGSLKQNLFMCILYQRFLILISIIFST